MFNILFDRTFAGVYCILCLSIELLTKTEIKFDVKEISSKYLNNRCFYDFQI